MPFSQIHADAACNFFELVLKHTADEYYGKPFLLMPWQEAALQEIFGQLDDHGNRIIETAYMEVPKKAGKTEFAAGIILYDLATSTLKGNQVYGAAAATRQAMNVYRAVCKMVEQSPLLSKRLRILRGTNRVMRRDDPDSFYAAVAADGDFGDGVNPACFVADEVHRWKTRKQMENWDVLSNGGITRKQTLTIAITTAGVQNESPLAWRLHEKARKIQEGIVSDPKFYGRVYGAEKSDDASDPKTWVKANPSLQENGGFLPLDKIRQKYDSMVAEGELASFKRYFLNIWDQKEDRAIDMGKWDACRSAWTAAGLQPKLPEERVRPLPHDVLRHFVDRRCWAGIDLSQTTDLSSVVFVFDREDGGYDLLPFFYLPADAVRKRQLKDGMPYQAWAEQGFLETSTLIPGVVSYQDIQERLEWGARLFDLQEMCFDPWNSHQISAELVADGHVCIDVPQGFAHLNEPSKKVLELVEAGLLGHGEHPIMRWNASCVAAQYLNDNMKFVKPDRAKSTSRIDGIAAAVNALTRAIIAAPSGIEYTGLRSVGA